MASEEPKAPTNDGKVDSASDMETSAPPSWARVQLSFHPSAASAGAPKPSRFAPGDLLVDRFRILRFIAKGGMGEVYEAEDLELQNERVAIKTILPAIADNPQMLAQFKREIQLARKVTHPNVCRIFDLVYHQSPSGSIAFLTMELLEGEPLSKLIERTGGLPLEKALPLATQMADGLHAAHRAGVVHQDFKPSNVMMAPGNRLVITDFGLAHNVRDSGQEAGKSAGTPAYMAPEQIETKTVSPATDVYALGAVLYELLTGHWPYNGRTPEELQRKKLNEAPVLPTKYVPDLSPDVERALLRCLARSPEDRFQNTLDVVKALTPRRKLRGILLFVCTVLALLAAAGIYRWRQIVASRVPTVAVLGFKNNSGAASYDWLATELSESLTSELGRSQQFHTVASDDVIRLRTEFSVPPGGNFEVADLPQISGALGANYLLSGGYTVAPDPAGDTININVKLQTPGNDGDFDFHQSGKETDYRKVVANITAEVRKKLGATDPLPLDSADPQNIYSPDSDARKLYFEGLDKLRAFDGPAAVKLFQQAAERDKSNVAIHSALADSYAQLRLDPQATREAEIAATLAEQNPALPLEYVVLTKARAAEMNKNWDGAASDYGVLFQKFNRLNYGLQLALVQTEGSHTSQALQTLNRLSALPAPLGNDPRIQMAFAKTYGAMTQPAEQVRAAQAALDAAKHRNSRMMQAHAQLQLCWAYRNQGDMDRAAIACNEAQNLFTALGDNVSAAVALNDLATLRVDAGRYPEALQLFDRVIAINKAAGAIKDYAGANVNAARTAVYMGKPEDAQDYLNNALAAAHDVNDKYDECRARIILAEVLFDLGKLDVAEAQARTALALGKELMDEPMQAAALDKLARAQAETNTTQALTTYDQILSLTKNKDARAVATALNDAGEVLFRRGELDAAERYYQQSLKLFRDDLKDRNATARNWLSLARLDLERKNLAAAERQSLDALKEFQSSSDQDGDSEEEASSLLVRIYVAGGRATEAEPYISRIKQISSTDRDVMFNSRMAVAEYLDAIGKRAEAVEELQLVPTDAQAAGRHFIALEAGLVLARLRFPDTRDPKFERETRAIKNAAAKSGFSLLVIEAERLR